MSKNLIHALLAGALGMVLAVNGLTILTWGFWVVFIIVTVIRFLGNE